MNVARKKRKKPSRRRYKTQASALRAMREDREKHPRRLYKFSYLKRSGGITLGKRWLFKWIR